MGLAECWPYEVIRISRSIQIGGFDQVETLMMGGSFPVVVQTMWKDRLSFSSLQDKQAQEIIARINRLGDMGCALIRFAVPDMEAAEVLGTLAGAVSMPLCADIHFDYKIALRCLDFPIAKLRINPGNIGSADRVRQVLEKTAKKNRPIRIGVNAGSLPQDLRRQVEQGMDTAEALAQAAQRELAIFEEFGFKSVVVSMKASGIADTIKASCILSGRTDVPMHIGLTEAGPLVPGTVKNTAAVLALLGQGIGDTLRVSLSDTVENEVIAGREILAAAAEMATDSALVGRFKRQGAAIVSCPRCGRASFDTHGFCQRWMDRLYSLKKNITVAVMGCAVNGPQEAKHADIGITGAGNTVLIFRRGEIIRHIEGEINDAAIDAAFSEELLKL